MRKFYVFLLCLAALCFIVAALLPERPAYTANVRIRLVGLGLFLVTLVSIIAEVRAL